MIWSLSYIIREGGKYLSKNASVSPNKVINPTGKDNNHKNTPPINGNGKRCKWIDSWDMWYIKRRTNINKILQVYIFIIMCLTSKQPFSLKKMKHYSSNMKYSISFHQWNISALEFILFQESRIRVIVIPVVVILLLVIVRR